MNAKERVICKGHPNIAASHKSTFEITVEQNLSPSGTCIIGVGANKGAATLSPEFRRILADDRAVLTTTLFAGGDSVIIQSQGSAKMTLNHPTDLVWRRSSFVCGRTVGVYSDHTARTLPRGIIKALAEGNEMVVEMQVVIPDQVEKPSVPLLQGLFHIP